MPSLPINTQSPTAKPAADVTDTEYDVAKAFAVNGVVVLLNAPCAFMAILSTPVTIPVASIVAPVP